MVKSTSPSSREDLGVRLGLRERHARLLDRSGELVELLAHLVERPVDAPASRSPTTAARRCTFRASKKSGERLGHVVEDALPALLLGLDLLPALAHAARGPHVGVAEDVRVPADELLVHFAGDRLEVALTPLLEQEREEVDLEEQVAELSVQLGVVAAEAASATS